MRAALAAGAAIINDVRALQWPGALEAVADSDCGLVLMHMQGTPRTMQQAPYYRDVTSDVAQFLTRESAKRARPWNRRAAHCGRPGVRVWQEHRA